MDIPFSKALYSASLFVAEKPSLREFSMVIYSGETRTSPTLEPLWFAALSTDTFHNKASCREIVPIDFSSMFYVAVTSSNGGSANSATRSARTWPLIEVQGMYLMLKAPRTVPRLAILPVNQHFEVWPWVEAKSGQQLYVLGSKGEAFMYHAPPLGWLSLVVDNEPRPYTVICSHSKLVVVCHCQLVSTPNSQHEGPQQCRQIELHPSQDWTWWVDKRDIP